MRTGLFRLPGVYRPQADTWLLARALCEAGIPRGGNALDLFTGTGAVAIAADALGARRVTAVDLSRRAVLSARVNCALARVDATVHRGDFAAFAHGDGFDLVTANPPYVPAPDGAVGGSGRAWDAGYDGRAVLDRLCALLPGLLRHRGTALIVQSALADVDRTLDELRGQGLKAAVVVRETIPFGPVLRARGDWLRAVGRIEDGQRTEDLVVIRGDRIRS